MQSQYALTSATIRAVWDEDYVSFGDESAVYLELMIEDSVTIIRVENYGWLTIYIKEFTTEDELVASNIDEQIIGERLWAVVNSEDEIECFGKEPNSERLQAITRTGLNNPV